MSDHSARGVRVFLAIPGTSMGPDARWKDPKDVRAFFEKFGAALEQKLGRRVDLIVEREKREGGVIHSSMFREAWEADVFIADLTGHNPNVFLELGVRYALRKKVTIPVSQSSARLPFDIEHMRAVQYTNRPDDVAIGQLVEMVAHGLADEAANDSPVLGVLDLETVDAAKWREVSGERRDTLVRAARQRKDDQFEAYVELLQEAIDVDPHAFDVRLELVQALRRYGSFLEGLRQASAAIQLDPSRTAFHQESGICLGKLDRLEEAVAALEIAAELKPGDANILSGLGGSLRRIALSRAPDTYDESAMRQAHECYRRASEIEKHNTYPALNLVRLELLLSRFDPGLEEGAREKLKALWHLCAFEARRTPTDYWRRFDLADAQLLLGNVEEGLDSYRKGIALVPGNERSSVLSSPLGPLEDLIDAQVLKDEQEDGVKQAIELLEAQSGGKRG